MASGASVFILGDARSDWADREGGRRPPTSTLYCERVTRNVVGTNGNSVRHAPGLQSHAADGRLHDGFGRVGTDLRVSLTDRCQLRCSYCMPREGLEWLPNGNLLTDEEVVRLITIAVCDLGVEQIRFTGGEPLLRRGLEDIMAATTRLRTVSGRSPETALTTNGINLAKSAVALKAAGLQRINVSLDTLDPDRYARLTGRHRLGDVIEGLGAAARAGLNPIKINTVLMRGVNDDEALALVRWALKRGYQPRFIEQMPLGPQDTWQRDGMVTAAHILAMLRKELTLVPAHPNARGSAPAETWIASGAEVADGVVPLIGIVGSVTRAFCETCKRTRLTADGQLRSCLFARDETDLRSLLRGGASDREIADTWRVAMAAKQASHGIDQVSFLQPARAMSAIGG